MNVHHKVILGLIRERSGTPTHHTFSDSYLGNTHPRYPINAPAMREIASAWMKSHDKLSAQQFLTLLTSLIKGKSATEKCMAGVLLDYTSPIQRKFDPNIFDEWLDHLEGWAEVDTLCTGKYTISEIPAHWVVWKKLLTRLSLSKNFNKRRASLVLLCSPLRRPNDASMAEFAFQLCDKLKGEKEIIITKAISWVLRSAVIHHHSAVKKYIHLNKDSLPKIAVRETLTKLRTGTKSGKTN